MNSLPPLVHLVHHDDYYATLRTHDRRYDGAFFICVKSTKIYCRSVCPARAVAKDRCVFFDTQSQAEQAGFRPCLRCKPEQAPTPPVTSQSAAGKIATSIDDTLFLQQNIEDISPELERQFVSEFKVRPAQYLMTRRLLFAKQLLQETSLTILGIARAAGFTDTAQLRTHMEKAYRFAPDRFRRKAASPKNDFFTLHYGYIPAQEGNVPRLTALENRYNIAIKNDVTKYRVGITVPTARLNEAYSILRHMRHLLAA